MDDALKGKVFQSPAEGINSGQSVQSAEPPNPESPLEQESVPIKDDEAVQPLTISQKEQEIPETVFVNQIEPNPLPRPDKPIEPSSARKEVSDNSSSSAPRFSGANVAKLLIGLFAVLLVGFAVFVLVLPNLGKKEQKVELTLWDLPDSLAIPSVLPDFEKENPNINVTVVKQDIKDYKDKLVTRSKNGNGPDLFRFNNTWTLQLSDILLPIPSDIITKSTFESTFYPVVIHDLVKNGAIYGIPFEINTLSLFVNSAMLKQADLSVPTNWNDFISASRSLTLKDQSGNIKTAGSAMGIYDNVTHAPDIVSMLMSQDGVNLDDITTNKDRVSDALNFYTGFAQSDGSVWDSMQPASIIAFSKGTLAMFFGYQKDASSIKSANPSIAFDVVGVPHLTGQNQTIAAYYPLGVSLKSKHQKEALLFLKFLSQKNIAAKLTSLPPARMDLPDKTNGGAKNAVSSYFTGETFDNGLNSQMNAHLADAINSIVSGNPLDSATANLVLGFSQVLGQFLPKQ